MSEKVLGNIRIVLVRPFHPGNIGSAARAMKTMGLGDLYLVEPKDFDSNQARDEAIKMATGADDIVRNATQIDKLYTAVKDCTVVIASTARKRGYDKPMLSPEDSAKMLYTAAAREENVALVFGPERMGLSNEDLELAKYRVTIPTSQDYSSLNLGAAVQTLAYEVFKQSFESAAVKEANQDLLLEYPDTKSMESFYTHLENTFIESGFIIKNHPGEVMQKLRTLFARSQPDKEELNILRGMLASVQRQQNKSENR